MNDTSCFEEVRSSTFRSRAYRLLHEQVSNRNRFLAPFPYSQSQRSLHTHQRKARKDSWHISQIPVIQRYMDLRLRSESKTDRIKRGGRHMKAGTYFLLGILILIGLLLSAGPAAAGSDTNAHAYTTTGCTIHVPSIIYAQGSSYTFVFCRAGSAATSWKAEIRNSANALIGTCSPNPTSWANLPPNTRSITCTNLPGGTIKTKVFWYVGGSPQMEHPHNVLNQ